MLSNSARNEAGRPKLKLRGLSAQIRMSLLWSLCVMIIIGILPRVPYFIFVLGEQNSGDRGNTTSSTSSSGSALFLENGVFALVLVTFLFVFILRSYRGHVVLHWKLMPA